MTDDDNPIESKEFEAALSKLEAGSSEEMKSMAMLIVSLRDSVVTLQEQMTDGEDEDEDDDEDTKD